MSWDAWMSVFDWALFAFGCASGVFIVVTLSTNVFHVRWERRLGGVKTGRLQAKGAGLMSLFLISQASSDLFGFPRWLILVLTVFGFACLGGFLWLLVIADRVKAEAARQARLAPS